MGVFWLAPQISISFILLYPLPLVVLEIVLFVVLVAG